MYDKDKCNATVYLDGNRQLTYRHPLQMQHQRFSTNLTNQTDTKSKLLPRTTQPDVNEYNYNYRENTRKLKILVNTDMCNHAIEIHQI